MESMTASTPAPRLVARAVRRLRWQLPLIAVTGLVAAFAPLGPTPTAHAANGQTEGLACAEGSTAPGGAPGHTPATPGTHPSFVLTATDGYVLTPDGNSIYDWGYANNNGSFQVPGPILCVHEGDTVTVTLRNNLPVDTSIVFQGITDVTADGAPSVPDLVDNSLTKVAPRNPASEPNAGVTGGQVTYSFIASSPGTYAYESGTDPQVQVQMGLSGVLIVRPTKAGDPTYGDSHAYDDYKLEKANPGCSSNPNDPGYNAKYLTTPCLTDFSHFNPEHEYLHVLTEIDPDLHVAYEGANSAPWSATTAYTAGTVVTEHGVVYNAVASSTGAVPGSSPASWGPLYDLAKYKARYWTINGRSFPDTIAPNYSAHLPAQPYGALVHIQPESPPAMSPSNIDYNPWPALVRFINVGPVNYPFHPHADHDHQLGIEGTPLVNPGADGNNQDMTIDHFGFVIAPGETTEATFSWYDAQQWNAATNPIGVPIPDAQSRFEGAYWSGSPYLGVRQDLATGVTQFNQCGEMYHVAHSHALFQATNYGIPATGMLTMIRVDPPNSFQGHANCQEG
jgi:hypothetical protein